MGIAYLHGNGGSGGGTSLGFEIVGGTIRPGKPTQNMVWVNTDVDITSYAFSATEPENPVEGMLWVTIADSSSVKSVFTVDKEWVTLYLVSVKQYISGAWVGKSAMNYQNGTWTDWWTGELYTPGNEWESITGGFATKGFPLNTGDAPQSNPATITRNADNIRFTNTDAGCGLGYFVNKIKLTDFNTLTFVGEMKYSGNSWYTGLGIWKDISTAVGTNRVAYLNGNSTGGAIDISSVDPGEYYIGFWIRGSGSYINLTSLILS